MRKAINANGEIINFHNNSWYQNQYENSMSNSIISMAHQ